MSRIIPIMTCFDTNYVIPGAVAFYSLLKHANPSYEYIIHVLHNDITAEQQNKLKDIVSRFPHARIEFMNMEGRFEEEFSKLMVQGIFSKEVLYKLLAPSIFPQYSKMLITDVDVIFMDDIAQDFERVEGQDFYVAGIRPIMKIGSFLDTYYKSYEKHYSQEELSKMFRFCGGYLIFDLEKMRETNLESEFVSSLQKNAHRLFQAEQDVINLACPEDKCAFLPLKSLVCTYAYDIFKEEDDFSKDKFYQANEICDALNHPVQLHYATATKPWKFPESTKAELWFKYLEEAQVVYDWVQMRERQIENILVDKLTAMPSKSPQENIPLLFPTKKKSWSFAFPSFFRRKLRLSADLIKFNKDTHKYPVMVSVLCLTYNHEAYIRNTLEAFVKQKVDFAFEVIVADDASTDKTQDIIREYHQRYPHIFKPILREKNVGVGKNATDALRNVRGKYLAFCDGDDLWLDENKLKKQVQYMERHPDTSVCCSNALFHHVDGSEPDSIFRCHKFMPRSMAKKKNQNFTDLLNCHFIASCTCMLRWKMHYNIPDWLEHHVVIDFPVTLIHAAYGNIKVIDEVFSQYNIHKNGVSRNDKNKEYKEKMNDILDYVNSATDFMYSNEIMRYKIKRR